jgi:hypothetical protein
MKIITLKTITVALMLVSLWGCVQSKPVPGYARAGDIVVVGLGGIERNSASTPVLKRDDLTITITDANNDIYDLAASNIFKSYPDYKAFMNKAAIDGGDQGLELVPFDGGWFAVVLLSTFVDGTWVPLPLATGPATIAVSSPKLTSTLNVYEGDLNSLNLEILPGEATVDQQYLQQFSGYAPAASNFVISPGDLGGIDNVAGAFFKIDYYDDTYFMDGIEPVVVPSGHNPFVQLAYNVVSNGNGTGSINVTLLNPAGFKSAATGDSNSSLLADLSVNFLYFAIGSEQGAAIAKTKFHLDTTDSFYIDGNGAIIDGLSPTFTHYAEL